MKFVGWSPFESVCTYRFEDITETLTAKEINRISFAPDPTMHLIQSGPACEAS